MDRPLRFGPEDFIIRRDPWTRGGPRPTAVHPSTKQRVREIDPNPMSGIDPVVRMRAFLQGDIVLGELFELTRAELYEICAQAQRLFGVGKYSEARRLFVALTALDPYNADFHIGLGVVLQKLDELEFALIEYDRAVFLDSRSLAARCHRAEVLLQLGRFPAAARDIEKLLALDPEGQSGFSQRARGLALCVQSVVEDLSGARSVLT